MEDTLEEFKLSQKVIELLNDKTLLKDLLLKGTPPQEILSFSDITMAKFYRSALSLFDSKKYLESQNAFLFLVSLNGDNYDYWLGYGMSTQLSGDFEGAIDAYEMAAMLEIESPVPYFYLAKCLFAIHDRESSVQALEMAIEYATDKDEYSELKTQATSALELLLNDK